MEFISYGLPLYRTIPIKPSFLQESNSSGTSTFSLNSNKPFFITDLRNGRYEISVANAILVVDMNVKEYLSITAKKIATSMEGLDSGDLYIKEDGFIMVVE